MFSSTWTLLNIRLAVIKRKVSLIHNLTILDYTPKHPLMSIKILQIPIIFFYVGEGLCALPSIKFFTIGTAIKDSIEYSNKKYISVSINKYVIMPNHIHLLVRMKNETGGHRDPPLQFHFKCDLQEQNRPFLRSVLITHSELRIPH